MHVNPWAEYELSYYLSQAEDQMGLRFEPAKGIKPRMLPEGMMVAAPVFTIARTGGEARRPSRMPGSASPTWGRSRGATTTSRPE